MKRQYILGLVSGIAISSVLVVNAAQTHTTIESCAQLLPHGETYELTIKGTIETNEQEPLFTGNMNLTAGAEGDVPDIQREEVTPFANCVKSFRRCWYGAMCCLSVSSASCFSFPWWPHPSSWRWSGRPCFTSHWGQLTISCPCLASHRYGWAIRCSPKSQWSLLRSGSGRRSSTSIDCVLNLLRVKKILKHYLK